MGVTTQTACYVPSCLSGLVRVGCYVTSCLSGLVRVGWGLQHRPRVTCRPVCRGYNTDRVLRAILSVGVTTQTACYVPSCLSGLQHRPRVTCRPVCLQGVGWGYMPAILSVCIVKSEKNSTTGFLMYQNNVSCERYISM